MYMKRPALNALIGKTYGRKQANGWQAVDATPQEASRGGSGITPADAYVYQMGPASLALLRQNADPRGAAPRREGWDHEFVISEVNADIQMWVKDENASTGWSLTPKGCNETEAGCGFASDPFNDAFATIGLQLSTKKKGAISAECARTESSSDEPRDCTKDLDDVTLRVRIPPASDLDHA